MNKKIFYYLLVFLTIFTVTGCNEKNKESNNQINNRQESKIDNSSEVIKQMTLLIDNKEYTLKLEDNETVKELIKLIPQELNMDELNGNEKYVYLNNELPTNPYNPKRINAGDVMLYGNNCLVIFYKSFDTPYNYTKIGHIDNLPNLGNSSITVIIK